MQLGLAFYFKEFLHSFMIFFNVHLWSFYLANI